MKQALRALFAPLLNPLESGGEPYHYRPLSRQILLFFGVVFCGLGALVLYLMPADADPGYYLPVVVFIGAGSYGLVVGLLGNDRAVAKIWGNK